MMSIRTAAAAPSRLIALRAVSPMISRGYSDSRQEGATGSSKGFSQREQAEEGQYVKKREAEKLKAAKEKAEAAASEYEKLKKASEEKK